MERRPVYPEKGEHFIILQHISEGGGYFSIGDSRRQAEAVGSALAGLWHSITGRYPHQERRKLLVVEAGSGQGRLHSDLSNYLNAQVVGIEKHPGAVEEGRKRNRKILHGDYTEEGPWKEIRESFGSPDLAFMVYTSLQGDPTRENPKELIKKALKQMLRNAKGVLFEIVFPRAGLEKIINKVKEGEISHDSGKKERYRIIIVPHDKKFGWWIFEQNLHDERGEVIAQQRAAIPIPLTEEAFREILKEVGKEIGKQIRIVDVRDRDSHKPAGKEYAHWYLLTTEDVRYPYKETRILERKLTGRRE